MFRKDHLKPYSALRLGAEVSKGSISKRLSGHLDWPLVEIIALEDAVGDPCVRRSMAGSLPEIAEGRNLLQATADVVREHGEAVAAVMDFASGRGDHARARKEVQDVVAVTARLAAMMEAAG